MNAQQRAAPACEYARSEVRCSAILWRANWRVLPVCTTHLGADAKLLAAEGRALPEVFGAFDWWGNEPEPYEPPLIPGLFLGDMLSEAAARFASRVAPR